MAVKGASETAEREETVNSDTEPADSATVSVEGRARQTDWDAVGLNWTSLSVQTASTVSNCSSSK